MLATAIQTAVYHGFKDIIKTKTTHFYLFRLPDAFAVQAPQRASVEDVQGDDEDLLVIPDWQQVLLD